ncbi:MAG: nitroreductase family protein, partial [Bdellovibrionales bacterium]|nr:nitroreductase family protein [Bdellovibrionales bacterium]
MTDRAWTTEQVDRFFEQHWTVRKYKNFAMPPSHLKTILGAAQRAPTDATAQMYSFVRLTDSALRKDVAECTHNPHFATA